MTLFNTFNINKFRTTGVTHVFGETPANLLLEFEADVHRNLLKVEVHQVGLKVLITVGILLFEGSRELDVSCGLSPEDQG